MPINENFTLANALNCLRGDYTHRRHNEIRDCFANLLNDFCHYVKIKFYFSPLQWEIFALKSTKTEDDARLDIKLNGLLEFRFIKIYFDVRIANLLAKK